LVAKDILPQVIIAGKITSEDNNQAPLNWHWMVLRTK
jgi:hypothetical protein